MAFLTKETRAEAKELLEKLFNLNKEKVELEFLKKEREENLKGEIAELANIRDKEGSALASKVKMPLVVNLINELFLDKPNKKEEEYATMEAYRIAFKDINKEVVDSYLSVNERLDEIASATKEAFKDTNLLSKEVLDAIVMFSKMNYQELLTQKNDELGIEKKEPKDDTQALAIIKELKALAQTEAKTETETNED